MTPWLIGVGWLAAATAIAPTQDTPLPVPGLAARMEQRVVAPGGAESLTTRTLVLVEGTARMESADGPDRGGYAEYQLYDFVRGRVYRVLPEDRMYFDGVWSKAASAQGFLDGWAPRPDHLAVRMIPLKDDEVDGTPARLSLMEYRIGADGSPAYAFVWSGEPPGRLPVRVAYTQRGGQTVIISYRNPQPRGVDPSEVSLPPGFVNLSPF
ncbi:MAG: hypothetical protein ACOYXR_04155 [Nitrospirota bacterium]